MRAVQYDSYGPPRVLRVATVPRPVPGEGEALVRVQASSVNGGELAKRQGRLRFVTGRRFPQPSGVDLVGVVAALGPGAAELPVGSPVWGTVSERAGVGTQAEYVAVPVERLSAPPRNLGAVDAATLLAGGTTALAALRDVVRLRAGEHLLVRGAAGGVGSVAVQVGVMLGARVTGLASESSADFVRGLGASEVIDYRTPARDLGRFDVIFDTRGSQVRAFRERLAPSGRMVTIAPDPDHLLRGMAVLAASAIHGSRRVRLFLGDPRTALLRDVADAAESGALRPVRQQAFPLEGVASAHEMLEAGGVRGKLVLSVAE